MKKFLSFLFLALTVGCTASSQAITPILSPLEFVAETKLLNETVSFNAKARLENDSLELLLYNERTETKYTFNGEKLTISHQDLSYTDEISSLPESLPIDFLYDSINHILKNKLAAELKEGEFIIEAETKKYKFKAYFGASGIPLKLENKDTMQVVLIKNAAITK